MTPEKPQFDHTPEERPEDRQSERGEHENQESHKQDSPETQSSSEEYSPKEEGLDDSRIQDVREGINKIWEDNTDPEDRMNKIKERLGSLLDNLDSDVLSEEEKQKVERNIEALSLIRNTGEEEEDKERFTETTISALEPLLKIREKYPQKFEKASAKKFNQDEGFTEINRVLSYGYNEEEGEIHLHAPPAKTLEGMEVAKLYSQGMQEMAKKIYNDSGIKEITARSSIVYNNPDFFEKYGFTVQPGKEEGVAFASVDRDTFLNNPKVKKILKKSGIQYPSSNDGGEHSQNG